MLKEILKILQNDAHTTTKQISAMIGMPSAEVTKPIKQAEKEIEVCEEKAQKIREERQIEPSSETQTPKR